MTDGVTANEALRHSKETRKMLDGHVEDCASYRKESNEKLDTLLTAAAAMDAVREERTGQHEQRFRSQGRWIALGGIVLTALGVMNILKDVMN
jgi:hypothetical protein